MVWWKQATAGTRIAVPLQVTLTAQHLAEGKRKDACECPVARACNAQLGGKWCIQEGWALQYVNNYIRVRYPLSARADDLVAAIDRGEQVTPQTFDLDAPPVMALATPR